ncbi:helix-turn-helix domain-containing protein [Enteractinococcus coprophilus]|uniref:Excisionase family DNA binding protein n=2 Tax=Micrococcales TaxID=85006 RepID=A0A542ZXU6_9MICC|nr:helix-turn-helix domain-containing protein [Enteractinococcus coprophilus]TQL65177.1 excisionase family DNA binding protein [Enteractinococcus coprophilus]
MTQDAVEALLADQPDIMTPQEVADLLRVSHHTIARWRRDGRLRAFDMGRTVRIRKEDLRELLQAAYGQPPKGDDET